MLAIAHDQRRLAPCGGHQFVAHHQQAVIVAGQKLFHQHGAIPHSGGIGFVKLLSRGDVDRDPFALVAVLGFDHNRQTDFMGNGPGFVQALGRAPHGHGHACRVQQAFGQVLVLSNRFGNGAGGVGFGGLDASLLGAPAKLHHAAIGEATDRDAACHGGVHDGPGRRPKAHVFVVFVQLRDGAFQVEAGTCCGGLTQLLGQAQRQTTYHFFGVLHHHLKHAGLLGGHGAAEGHRAACERLQAQGHFLQGMRQRDGLAWTLSVKWPDRWKDAPQLLLDRVLRRQAAVCGVAADDGFDGGVSAPQIGATQSANARNLHEGCFQGKKGGQGRCFKRWASCHTF